MDPGHLKQCQCCELFFRFPYLDSLALKKAYSEINTSGVWEYGDRKDYSLALQIVSRHCQRGKVLDVGCFRGDFLRLLSDSCERYGIEPSPDAREIAQSRGIQLIAETIDEVDGKDYKFDAITMLDVLEHLPQPVEALKKVRQLLEPDGILIIATGDTDALPWRFMRLNYWYYFPEHVSFVNRKWFDWAAKVLGMKVLKIKRFSHFPAKPFVVVRQCVEAMVYSMMHQYAPESLCYRFLMRIYPFSRVPGWKYPPKTTAWNDHILVVLRNTM